jgi:hypothetical protein
MNANMNNKPDKQLDARLDALLRGLPDKPVPSNFTARVLQAVESETPAPSRAGSWTWWMHTFMPRAGAVAAVVCLGSFAWHGYRVQQRTNMAQSIAAISKVNPLANPEVLADYDAIRRLSQARPADEELLALMK